MSPTEKFCPLHGPYDAALPQCPYCAAENIGAGRPPAPEPLGLNDFPSEREWIGHGSVPPSEGDIEDLLNGDLLADEPAEPLDAPEGPEHTVLLKPDEIKPTDAILGIFWVKAGPLRGQIFPLKHGAIIGRNQGDVRLPDPAVSDPHAKLTLEGETFMIWDFGSSNGTFVNGERIRAATPLQENDEIRFGNTTVVLKILA